MKKGLVIKFIRGKYLLIDTKSKSQIIAHIGGKLQNDYFSNKDNIVSKKLLIKIGDIVFYESSYDKYFIKSIQPRKNELIRPNIANVDQVILCFSLHKPRFTFRFLDKFLLIVSKYDLKIILIFTKIDLLSSEKLMIMKNKISYYQQFYTIYYINTKNLDNYKNLRDIFTNTITVLGGQTGVGKSTLLNGLKPNLLLKTQEISLKKGIGRHTTKNAQLYEFTGGYIADTPGFSKLDLTIFTADELKNFYIDFAKYVDNCFFKTNCNHIDEIDCGVKKAVQQGIVIASRYDNYVSFFYSIKAKKNKYI